MAKCTKCSKLDKASIVAALQAGQDEPGGPVAQTFTGSLDGTILTDGGTFNGVNLYGNSQWDQTAHPVSNFSIGPLINPACGGPNGSQDIGTIVINPSLPAGLTATTFDLTIDILDNSAGLGSMFLFCVNDLQIFGTSQSGFNSTTTWDISGAPCPPEDIRVGMTAFGATNSYPVTSCDEINPVPETIVVVTPSACLGGIACLEEIIGCSLADAVQASGALDGINAKFDDLDVAVYRLSSPENGYDVQAWFNNDGKAVAHPPGLNTDAEVDDFINSVWAGDLDENGIPAHINGEPSDRICYANSSNFNDGNSAFPDGEGSGLDQYYLFTCIDTRGLGVIDLQDVNGNSGEAGHVFLSRCCEPFEFAGRILDTRPYYAGTFATALPEGLHCVLVLLSDRSAFGGFQLQYAPTGTEEFTNVPIARMYKSKREIECKLVKACDLGDTLGEWSVKPPALCEDATAP